MLSCMQSSSGSCNTYRIVVGNTAHPEGFCQRTCNHCGDYCIAKNGKSTPAGSRSSGRPSATPSKPAASSGKCSDTPPSNQYSCAQQVGTPAGARLSTHSEASLLQQWQSTGHVLGLTTYSACMRSHKPMTFRVTETLIVNSTS